MDVRESGLVRAARQRIGRTEAAGAWDDLREILCEPTRRRIVEALSEAELSVGDLAAAVGHTVPATSQHLRVLRERRIVEGERRASRVYYRLRPSATVEQIEQLFHAVAGRPKS